MSEPKDVTPERLAELADGSPPRDDAEREVMALMAEVRALDDPAPDAVRERVRAIASGASEPAGLRGWWEGAGRRRLLVVGAPVVAAVAALAIAIPVLNSDDSSTTVPPTADSSVQAGGEGATALTGPEAQAPPLVAEPGSPTPAPSTSAAASAARAADSGAPEVADRQKLADPDQLEEAVDRARSVVIGAGGTVVSEADGAREDSRVVVAEVPADGVDAIVRALRMQGDQVDVTITSDPGADPAALRVTVTPGG